MNITNKLKSITPKYCRDFPALAWGDIQEAVRIIEEMRRAGRSPKERNRISKSELRNKQINVRGTAATKDLIERLAEYLNASHADVIEMAVQGLALHLQPGDMRVIEALREIMAEMQQDKN